MAHHPIPTYCFAVVVVRHDDRFLLVQEKSGLWFVPAGGLKQGEDFAAAAVRETREEAGISVRLLGIVRIEHTPAPDYARLRVVYVAEPAGDTQPKTEPDSDSLGAEWVRLGDIANYELRGQEVRELLEHVARGGTIHAMSVFQPEIMPYGVE